MYKHNTQHLFKATSSIPSELMNISTRINLVSSNYKHTQKIKAALLIKRLLYAVFNLANSKLQIHCAKRPLNSNPQSNPAVPPMTPNPQPNMPNLFCFESCLYASSSPCAC